MKMLRAILVVLGLTPVACQSGVPRYLVTTAPIDLGVPPSDCIAINPTDSQGIWWWEPGQSGCSTRSTGPGVFHADGATVVATAASAPIDVRFRLQRIVGPGSTQSPFVDIQLTIQDGYMRVSGSAARVQVERRNDLAGC
jgi:hypothetical protein